MLLMVSYKCRTLESACFQVDVDLTPESAVDVQTIINTSRGLIFAFSRPKDPGTFSTMTFHLKVSTRLQARTHAKNATKRKSLQVNPSICWKIPAKF